MGATPTRVLVVGAGPAGIAAAMWLQSQEVTFRWLEATSSLGGTLRRVGNTIDEYPGLPPMDGPTLARRFAESADGVGVAPEPDSRLSSLRPGAGGVVCDLSGPGGDVSATFARVLLCTGTRPRRLGLPDEAALTGRGVEVSVNRNLARYAGCEVAVVGGGDAAVEGALLLADRCSTVHLVHRRDRLRAKRRFRDRLAAHPAARLRPGRRVVGLRSDDGGLVGIDLDDGSALPVVCLFVRVGVSAALPDGVPAEALDPDGYVLVDRDGRTRMHGVFAAGDVCSSSHQSVAAAVGGAARAAGAICAELDVGPSSDAPTP